MLSVLSMTLSGSGLPVVTVLLLGFFVFGQLFKQSCSLFSQRGISLPTGRRGCVSFQFEHGLSHPFYTQNLLMRKALFLVKYVIASILKLVLL